MDLSVLIENVLSSLQICLTGWLVYCVNRVFLAFTWRMPVICFPWDTKVRNIMTSINNGISRKSFIADNWLTTEKKKRTIDNLFQQSKEYPFKSSKRQRVLLSCPTKQKLFLTRFHQSSHWSKATNAHAIRTMVLTSCSAAALHRSPEQQLILHSPLPLQKSIFSVASHNAAVKQPFSKASTDASPPLTSA